MLRVERNSIIDDEWVIKKVDNPFICDSFDCGDDDLNDYFRTKSLPHREQLLTQSYYLFSTTSPDLVLALLDFCNDSVQLQKFTIAPEIPEGKKYPYLPAVKLTRFGVSKDFHGKNIGS